MQVHRTFKFKLSPSTDQRRELEIMLETHRRLYNTVLDGKQLCWDTAEAKWSFYDQCKWFTVYRTKNPWLGKLNVTSARNTMKRVDKAYQGFFKRGGFPKFKSKDTFNSFTFNYSNGGCKITDDKLKIKYVGTIKVKWHRQLPQNALIKQCTIVREGDKWFACFSVEMETTPLNTTGQVGIDMGIRSFITTDTGAIMGESNLLEKNLKKLRRLQRALSRCQKGSRRREKIKKRVKNLHAKVRNTRQDVHHKVSRTLINQFRYIAVESLDIRKMVKSRRLARRILDAAWGGFILKMTYKAESAGSHVILVNPMNTSQKCSQCGNLVKKTLATRTHKCECGLKIDRDVNAARNILAGALPQIAKLDNSLV